MSLRARAFSDAFSERAQRLGRRVYRVIRFTRANAKNHIGIKESKTYLMVEGVNWNFNLMSFIPRSPKCVQRVLMIGAIVFNK